MYTSPVKAKRHNCINNGQLLKGFLTLLNVFKSQNPEENRSAVNINIYLLSDFKLRAAEQGELMILMLL